LETLERDLRALNIPGLDFRRVNVTDPKTGKSDLGLYVEITDWNQLRPTELSLYMMALSCAWDPRNPFATATKPELSLYMKCMGSTAFYNDLAAHGSRVDVAAYVRDWQAKNEVYQQQSRRYWIYN
jgi:hypothetical protein